jgi:hypothetical protein
MSPRVCFVGCSAKGWFASSCTRHAYKEKVRQQLRRCIVFYIVPEYSL